MDDLKNKVLRANAGLKSPLKKCTVEKTLNLFKKIDKC